MAKNSHPDSKPEPSSKAPTFIDNASIAGKKENYKTIMIDAHKAVESWKRSLFSYEWINEAGFKSPEDLPEKDRRRREDTEQKIRENLAIEKPVLGIGMLDNIEVGVGRAVFLTLAIAGIEKIPVHIPLSQEDFFKEFEID